MALEHLASLILISSVIYLFSTGRRRNGLPPGPRGLPLVGNALQLPSEYMHWRFTEWARAFGDVFLFQVMQQTMIVLSSAEAVREVLDTQGLHTGGRPISAIYTLLSHPSFMILANMDTSSWKIGRRLIRDLLSSSILDRYLPIQDFESTLLLKDIADMPENLYNHIERATASSILTILYGRRCLTYKNTEIERFYDLLHVTNKLATPSAHPFVNAFPVLNLLPDYFAPWKPKVRSIKDMREEFHGGLLGECESAFKDGRGTGCFMESVLGGKDLNWSEMVNLGMVIMEAGAETSASTIQACILAAINYPDCQKKLHNEIDNVVGKDRLPVLDDFEKLPYVRAFIDELQRFRPLLPLSVPHTATRDVSYKEYHIPKDSIIFMNVWALFSDENTFDQPDLFNPERFLKTRYGTRPGVDDSSFRNNFVFGAGRRICPGEAVGRRTVAIAVMRLFWAFEFTKDNSGTGGIKPSAFECGLESGPLPFTCNVKPRDDGRTSLVKTRFSSLTQKF